MKIITCLKPVPDRSSRLFVNEDKTWIKDRDLTFVTSEADTHAIEAALRLRDATDEPDGEVIALSIGSDRSARVLRAGLAMGANRAIQVSDDLLAGSDEFVHARLIRQAVLKDGGADVLLTGVQSDDLGGGMTGIMAAELLGWPHASVVVAIEAGSEKLRVVRELEGGLTETLDIPTPCVLTVQMGINQPRYASLKGIMAAKRKELKVWGISDLDLSPEDVGAAGALYQVNDVFVPEVESGAQILTGTPIEAATQLIEKLRVEAKVI
jgi:electron transfer flavoprotein beta subunit